ncbi:MAG: dodecin domain-containing protein [Gemmatimonadetes bacterium]|nr:dodecin domain-containing protein [Gemmatimonadota bacterium]MCH9053798.1 dodecin domain-containing protein [Pseudomonadota bacterium]
MKRAAQTLHGITGLEVIAQKAKVENGAIKEYRATIEITFILD